MRLTNGYNFARIIHASSFIFVKNHSEMVIKVLLTIKVRLIKKRRNEYESSF